MMKELKKDKLVCQIYETRKAMGEAAANDIRRTILELLKTKETLNMIFAAAPSQNEVLASLLEKKDIPWEKINAFHMDEYIGLPKDAQQGFGNFLRAAIFDKVPFKSVNVIDSSASDIEAECERYTRLLKENPVDIVCLGIGENGHIAFNDPGVADFNDAALIKPAELDLVCRQQQVNDGCFASLEDVPKMALTLTIPALTSGKYMFCVVPAPSKTAAVTATMTGPITEDCPATVLRLHDNAVLYCDADSGKNLL